MIATEKKETICYIRVSHIRDVNKLKSHIRYIQRQQANPILDMHGINTWIERAKYEKSKRYDARVAMSMVIALPNDRATDRKFFQEVKECIANALDVSINNIDFVVHRNDPENLHMHMLIYPRMNTGKKIDMDKKTLNHVKKSYENFLKKHEYIVRYLDADERIDHIGYTNKADMQTYREKQRIKKEIEMLEKMMNEKVEEQDKKEEQIQVKQEDTKEAKKEQDKTITEAFNKVFDTLNKLTNNISQLKQTQMQKEQEIQQPTPKIQPQKQQKIQQQAQTQTVSKPIQQQAQLSQLSKGKEEEYDIQLLLNYWRDVEAYMKDKSREEREKYFIITALQEMKFKEELLLRAVMIIKQIDNATAEALIKRYIDTQEKSTSSNFNMDFSMEV